MGPHYGLPSYLLTVNGETTEGQIIPLDQFDPRWRTGVIGDDLRRHGVQAV